MCEAGHRSRGRPETKEEFVPERERKKAENEDSKSGKGKRLQMEKIRKSSVRQEAVEDTVEVTPEEKVSGYRKKLHRYEKIPDDDNNLNSQKKSIRKKQLQKQMTKEQAKAGRLSFDDEGRFGKGIINNSKTKIILNLEDDEAQRVQEALHLSDAETMEITHFERGHGLISTNNNNIMVEFKASPLEKDLITTDRRELREIVERKRREQSTSAEQQI